MDLLVRFWAVYQILTSKKKKSLNFWHFKNALVTDDVTGGLGILGTFN